MKRFSRNGNSKHASHDMNDKDKYSKASVIKKGKMRFIQDYLIDYTENCNLHGLKYIGEKKRTVVEKIFWATMFTCSFALCAVLIRNIVIKWKENPVIVTFAEKTTPIWQIPYPAVTICSETKSIPERFNFTKYEILYDNPDTYSNLTDEEKNMYEHISMVCGYVKQHSFIGPNNVSIDNIIKVAPTNKEMFLMCRWNQELHRCEDIFPPVLTGSGVCYTFNTLDAEDMFRKENLDPDYQYLQQKNFTQTWTLDTGYPFPAPENIYPRRTYGNGLVEGLSLFLQSSKDSADYKCSGPILGFKIQLHNPAELPRFTNHYVRLPLSEELLIAVKPKMLTTSEGLRGYEAERRQCYFQDQRYLSYFKVYTQNNCKLECLTNYTYMRCGCVHFGMPHGSHMPVCGAAGIRCMKKARLDLLALNMESVEDADEKDEARAVAGLCKCLPPCTSIEYEAETSEATIDWESYLKALQIDYKVFNKKFSGSSAKIYFKEAQFITSRRSELYGSTDFLANCGGLLGLCMGFSLLSVAEIVYFLTLRLWCLLRALRVSKTNSRENNIY